MIKSARKTKKVLIVDNGGVSYGISAEIMSKDYSDLFEKMIKNKEKYLSERKITLTKSYFGSKIFNFKRGKSNY